MEMTKFRISATEPGPYSLPAADIGRRIVNSGVGGGFSFPVLLSVAMVPPLVEELEEPARASLEVFRPSVELARILGKSTSAPIHVADDVACDGASSDLFELESFSAPSSTAYRRRRGASLHELPELATATAGAGAWQFRRSMEELIAPSECCYAPSEASVEWSVTTAEGGFERTSAADFSSAASEDGGKVRSAQTEKERFDSAATPARNEGGAVKKRGGDGGLLNCGCERAVNVGPDPVRFVPDQPRL
ncbi:putative protein PHYTOCHROME KINASE SUBSTRATE 4 [Iris pallida]|uniref:Uncharacterized protein n=1 Tax=Iris pallida TaxID=29817 RepID=A0AAX6E452_IRIPA|nr:putative protein PHYTOCHROME KINASE SUBSTRATE 4 [Iris pallida]